ncbi:MAG: c-type cytochrome [Gammaproteobacteria bacterium]|nr:c-type cytochrome [Gammaproteobacteria bacterium]
MRFSTRKFIVGCFTVALFGIAVPGVAAPLASYLRPEKVPAPDNNKVTPERVALGKSLFFDPRLSGSKWISCATCHNPALAWSDGLPTAIGHGMKVLDRATPTIINTAYQRSQMWDGRFRTLEEQALGPIQADVEMNQNMAMLLDEIQSNKGYIALFEKAYPGEGVNKDTLAKALASFERTIVSTESPFDRWAKGEEKAMSDAAKRGFALFEGKANCVACHQGFNFTDDGFHNIGLKGSKDPGRYAKKAIKSMQGAFKTPTLRDIALTAPYMHSGTYKTLTEVVEHYNRGGDAHDNLDPNVKPLNLSKQEVDDVVAFLNALTGVLSAVTVPRLPL